MKDIKIGFDAKAAAEAKAAEAKVAAERAAAAARAAADRAAADRAAADRAAAAARAVAERAAAERAEAELLRWKEELTKMANARARLCEAQGRVRLLAAVATPTVESSGSTGVVIGVIVCVIIALVLALVFMRRHCCYKPPPKLPEPMPGIPLTEVRIKFGPSQYVGAKAADEAKAAEAKAAAERAAAESAAAKREADELRLWEKEKDKMADARARLCEAQGRVRLLAAVATNEDESLRDATKVRDEARATLVRVLDDTLSAHHKGEVQRRSLTAEAAALQQQQQQGGCGLRLAEQVWLMGSVGL